tara:strand:- start:329 stop:1993 length:1665 start_codon:yes stop_codon:yes gene_type:complete
LKNTQPYVLTTLFILYFSLGIIAQDYTLKLTSKNTIENTFLSKIDFKKEHKDSISIFDELNRIHKLVQVNGYFLSVVDSLVLKQKNYFAFFNMNQKVDSVILKQKNFPEEILRTFNFKQQKIKMPINQLAVFLNKISETFESKGNSFSKIRLKNITILKKVLYADIAFNASKERKINKLILKGYENFPSSFIKNYFNIKEEMVFNKKKLNEISRLSKSLNFVSEIKAPETLFTKDSTFVYVYLKKNKGNSFDGLVNLASQENGKLKFNGYIDLKLRNILNKGERFNLLWNSFGNERQEFAIATKIPYIFNSKLSPELNFSIYKQDTTFLNTKFNSNLQYQIKSNASLFVSFTQENSESLTNVASQNIETFTSTFLGLGYQYTMPKNDLFRNNIFFLNINPSFGNRKSENNSFRQIKLEGTISYLLDISKRSSIYLKNKTGVLNSENYIQNELFRIGGNNSIRGFNEQSIFVKDYVIQNIEYRYLLSNDAFIYSITDLALIATPNTTEKLMGLGIGYLFNTNNAQINISTTLGTDSRNPINFKNTQLFINWINFF